MNNQLTIKHVIDNKNVICFIVPALFNKSECESLLNEEVKRSFQKAILNYSTYYRNNDRLLIDDENLANTLFKKVKPYLPETIETDSHIRSENGTWTLQELNSRIRYCRYSSNQYFHRHLDGIHYRSDTEQSKLTFMIYLNGSDEFAGGRTLFYETKDSTDILAAYIPRQGDLIVFDHNVWHEGEMLLSGEKFVLRSDILYKKDKQESVSEPFQGHLGYLWKLLVFNEDTLLSGGRDKMIQVWNKKGESVQCLPAHQHSVLCLEKMQETVFISGSRDKTICVWQKAPDGKFTVINTLRHHSALILTLCRISETHFLSGSGDNTIKKSDLSGNVSMLFSEHTNWVWQIIKLKGDIVASCSEDGSIKLWNHHYPDCIMTFEEGCTVFCLIYHEKQNQLLSGNLHGEITIRDLDPDFAEIRIRKLKAHQGIIRSLIQLNETQFASGGEDNCIRIWDLEKETCVYENRHHNFVQSLAFMNNRLMSASFDGSIKVLDFKGGSS